MSSIREHAFPFVHSVIRNERHIPAQFASLLMIWKIDTLRIFMFHAAIAHTRKKLSIMFHQFPRGLPMERAQSYILHGF